MTTMAEPEWDEATRDVALAHAAIDLCPKCGGPAYLCQDPDLQDQWGAEDPVRCHRLTAVRKARQGFNEKTNPVVEALIFKSVLRGGTHGR